MASEVASFDQASAILDSNSEEAWGETKMRPRAANLTIASSKTPALQASFYFYKYASEKKFGSNFTLPPEGGDYGFLRSALGNKLPGREAGATLLFSSKKTRPSATIYSNNARLL